jgi:hypothetical protein
MTVNSKELESYHRGSMDVHDSIFTCTTVIHSIFMLEGKQNAETKCNPNV